MPHSSLKGLDAASPWPNQARVPPTLHSGRQHHITGRVHSGVVNRVSQFVQDILAWLQARSWPVLMAVPWVALVAYEVMAEAPCSAESPCRGPLGP